MGFCAGVCGDREYARGNGLAAGDASRSGTGSVRPAVRPNAVGGSVRRLVRLPAAISAPGPCRSGGACGIGDSVAFFRGTCCNDFPHGLRSVENLSKGGSPGVRRLAAGISTGMGMRVVGVTVGFHVSADGYRSGFSGARLLGAGLHVFMSGTDIFRFGHSGRERGPPASLSRRQIFRPRLHKPGEPSQSIR